MTGPSFAPISCQLCSMAADRIWEDMYDGISALAASSGSVQRGCKLDMLIRLTTRALGADGWPRLMGNPEWLASPRAGNNWSHEYCQCSDEHPWQTQAQHEIADRGSDEVHVYCPVMDEERLWMAPMQTTYSLMKALMLQCRRQCSLVDTEHLRYRQLSYWDAALQRLDEEHPFLFSNHQLVSHADTPGTSFISQYLTLLQSGMT